MILQRSDIDPGALCVRTSASRNLRSSPPRATCTALPFVVRLLPVSSAALMAAVVTEDWTIAGVGGPALPSRRSGKQTHYIEPEA
ncbi:MAG: hypothetical protein OXJ64_03095, partial [Boseongicola sp.]|nr:hypothetical protein [Boseongicola sp.]